MPLKNKDAKKAYERGLSLRIRMAVLKHYGGICTCCGENRWQFLAFDHKDNYKGDSAPFRPQGSMAVWLRKQGYPDYIQVLCHNCNHCRADYGVCIHNLGL